MGNAFDLAWQTFRDLGWLQVSDRPIPLAADGNLLPMLLEMWNAPEASAETARRGLAQSRCGDWLKAQVANGAALTVVDDAQNCQVAWHGPRLVWWPYGEPTGKRIGLASSRLGRRLDTQEDWFTVFRAACSKADRAREVLLTAADTTTERFVERAAELFRVRAIMINPPRTNETCAKWSEWILKKSTEKSEWLYPAFVSPVLSTTEDLSESSNWLEALPLRDRLVVAWSERLLVFHVRAGGHWDQIVRARLADSHWPAGSVYVALGDQLVPRCVAESLLELGAVGWLVLDTLRAKQSVGDATSKPRCTPAPNPILIQQPWNWLTHCTRAADGAWPDQSDVEYVDELLLGHQTADHSAFGTLRRILTEQRLLATSRTIRGQTPVVSFTAAPLCDLPRLHVFRPHQGRWDFEPFGICIDRAWLESQGARPVCYGDDAVWDQLPEADRPFFQSRETRGRRTQRRIDWTVEQEWRHLGNVELGELSPDAGFVFVATESQAKTLAKISRWPVMAVESDR